MAKKEAKKTEKKDDNQLEFDFTPKYYIKWHGINEDLKNKKGYKTRTRTVKSIVDDSIIYFESPSQAKVYIDYQLISQIIYHHYSKEPELLKITSRKSDITEDVSKFVTTFKMDGTNIKYWIEIKQK